MQFQIITIYCLCDDFLKSRNHVDPPRTGMSLAEVMTTVLVAAQLFGGNIERTRVFLHEFGYIPAMLGKSRLNRRVHQVPAFVWQEFLAFSRAGQPQSTEYIVDSCPVPVCHNIRIARCKIYQEETYRGYCASKKQYFFGLKLHLVVNAQGKPVEMLLTPGSCADITAVKQMSLCLPAESTLHADKGYNDYAWEDALLATRQIRLVALRKKHSKRPHPPQVEEACRKVRKQVETVFSQVVLRFARSIHAVTAKGFELKIITALLAYALT